MHRVTVESGQDLRQLVVTPAGHSLTVDASSADGGEAAAPSPYELLLAALGT